MKNARQEEIERNLKGWAGMLEDETTMDDKQIDKITKHLKLIAHNITMLILSIWFLAAFYFFIH